MPKGTGHVYKYIIKCHGQCEFIQSNILDSDIDHFMLIQKVHIKLTIITLISIALELESFFKNCGTWDRLTQEVIEQN